MPLTVRIDVTQKDINEGCIRNSAECPIARAGTRVFGVPVFVGNRSMDLFMHHLVEEIPRGLLPSGYREAGRIELPPEAVLFVRRFDRHWEELEDEARPFSFEVEIPDEMLAELPHLLLPLAVKEEAAVCVAS